MTLRRFWTLVDEMARMALRADASRFYFRYWWWIFEPLLYVAVFYLVFAVLLDAAHEGFLAFLMCGKLTFVWFSKSVVNASRSIVDNKGLIGKIDLPKALFPLAVVQEGLYRQAAVFVLLMLILVAKGYALSSAWLWLLPVALVNYLLIVGASLAGAYLVCLVFDFSLLISLAMVFLLFISGVFWDVRTLPDPAMADWVLALNPLAFLIDAYRQVLMFGQAPDLAQLVAVGLSAAALIAAMLVLMRRSGQFLALKAITS